MPALLAPDLVATLQRHARAAVAADIGGRRSIQRVGSVDAWAHARAEGVLPGAEGRNLVSFA